MGITAAQFKSIITKPAGEHWADAFIRWGNMPSPYVDNLYDFGLIPKKHGRPKKVDLPEPFVPMGTKYDMDRFNDKDIMDGGKKLKLTEYIGNSEVGAYLKYFEPTFKKILTTEEYNQLYDSSGKPLTSITNKKRADRKSNLQNWMFRDLQIISKKIVDTKYQDEFLEKVKHPSIISKSVKGFRYGMNLTPSNSDTYAAVSSIFLNGLKATNKLKRKFLGKDDTGKRRYTNIPNFNVRPLFGSSEKVEKSDGTKVAVSVMYLAPAKRSSQPFYDDWWRYSSFRLESDKQADEQGLFPSLPDFSKLGKIGKELQQQYDEAQKLFKAKGLTFYKNNPRGKAPYMKLCHNPNTCPFAGQCAGLCLVDSGQMGKALEPQIGGYLKTWYFFLYPLFFIRQIIVECFNDSKKSIKMDFVTFYARLNGTSDIAWERYILMDDLVGFINDKLNPEIKIVRNQTGDQSIVAFGGFYDYNKYPYEARKKAGDWDGIGGVCPKFYDLTYSISESIVARGGGCSIVGLSFGDAIVDAMEWVVQGFRVATVVDMWKFYPKRSFAQGENIPLATAKKIGAKEIERRIKKLQGKQKLTPEDIDKLGDLFYYRELVRRDKFNDIAGQKGKPIQIFKKRLDRDGEYVVDNNGQFVIDEITENWAVDDFNQLIKQSINSLDDMNRARQILVVDGDETDFRFNDPKPSIVILKPKGISVVPSGSKVKDEDGNVMPTGTIYTNTRNLKTGTRFNQKLTPMAQQFIMSKETVLDMQKLFLDILSVDEYLEMLPQTFFAINMKGDVTKHNLLNSVPSDLKQLTIDAAEDYRVQIVGAKALKTQSKQKQIKNPNVIQVLKENGKYIMVMGDNQMTIDGEMAWKSLKELKSLLADFGLKIANGMVVKK